MIASTRPVTRRCLLLALLISPMVGVGCGGNAVEADMKAGEKRRQKMEDLQKKANVKREPGKAKSP